MADQRFRVEGVDHVELYVPDQREAAAWYRWVLGLEVVEELADLADDGPLMVAAGRERGMLALFAGESGRCHGLSPDFRGVAFRVDGAGFAAFQARLADLELDAADGALLTADDVVDHGASLSLCFEDPWGHALEITTYEPDRARRLWEDA